MKKSVKKKPENLPSNGNIDFDKEFEYFYDICLVSKQKIYIGKFILEHPELFDKYDNCRIVIIDSLFHSASVYICKITNSDEQLNIITFKNNCSRICNTIDRNKWKTLTPNEQDLTYLKNRRNKNLVHSDKENVTTDITKEYPLTIETVERVINAAEAMLEYLYRSVKGTCFGGIDKSTNKPTNMIDIRIKTECENLQKSFNIYNAILSYMKESNPNKLLDIIYSNQKGQGQNGQTENAHAE